MKCNIAKSQALYSAQRGLRTNNAAVFNVGAVMINIPQHPATQPKKKDIRQSLLIEIKRSSNNDKG